MAACAGPPEKRMTHDVDAQPALSDPLSPPPNRPPKGAGALRGSRLCIGSDDPITFATSLPDEYQLILDTLTLAGVSSTHALQWIEDARQTGMMARFSLPR